ncbi:GntR family transcriptional regulator [Clostridium polyendosporum]|uniref:GntR family transcriptional regulator n=1 Tax=Clostridium polyendosporum TaxID=69208 RepID=A0A919RXM5_9CLOT|nr:PLP-dependent aminotransferase family protein [Clostridium polyendosporum]GIM28385.1 GntR family transcriptional regulator [Clostridium polyendosporum]
MPVNSFENYPMGWKPDRSRLKRPYYQSIAQLLEQDMKDGYLSPNTKLPPQRELADYLDLNFTTITRAYKLCELKGLIYTIAGSGTFVSPNAANFITISAIKEENQCIELGMVHSFEQTNYMINDTIKKVGHMANLDRLLGYDHPDGFVHHKQAGLTWMNQFGIHADLNHISLVSGSQNAIAIALSALFEPGDRIATDYYTYSNFIELAKLFHLQLIPIIMDKNGMLPSDLEYQCKKTDIKGIYLMPCCSNPTTIEMSHKRKQEISNIIKQHNLILLEDDTMAFLSAGINTDYNGSLYQLIPDQSVYICGTGKSICSGLRIAYIVYGEPLAKRIQNALYNINVKTSSLDAEIITRLILSGKTNEICKTKIELAKQANHIFSTYFPHLPSFGNPLSFFRYIPLETGINAAKYEDELNAIGVRVFSSNRFITSSDKKNPGLRISLSSTKDLDELKNGLQIVSNYLQI